MLLYLVPGMALAAVENNPWVLFSFSRVNKALMGNLGTSVTLAILMIACGLIAGAGSSIVFIGLLFTVPFSLMVQWHLLGQFGRMLRAQRV
jgi:hypothetical protein